MRWDKAQKDAIMRERLLDCAQAAGVQYSINHPHLTVSELDESVNHTVHNLFRSTFKLPEEQEIMDVSVKEYVQTRAKKSNHDDKNKFFYTK